MKNEVKFKEYMATLCELYDRQISKLTEFILEDRNIHLPTNNVKKRLRKLFIHADFSRSQQIF